VDDMRLENIAYYLSMLYITALGIYNILFIFGKEFSQIFDISTQVVLYIFFLVIILLSLSLFEPEQTAADLTKISILAMVFAIGALLLNKYLASYSIALIMSALLTIIAGSFPKPFSSVIKVVGLGFTAVITLTLATYASGLSNPLLIPNGFIYVVAIVLMMGYVVSLFIPWVFHYVSLFSVIILGVVAVVTGSDMLQNLPPALAARGLALIGIISGYIAAVTLIILGIISIAYSASRLIPTRKERQEEAQKIDIEPYAPDATKTR